MGSEDTDRVEEREGEEVVRGDGWSGGHGGGGRAWCSESGGEGGRR